MSRTTDLSTFSCLYDDTLPVAPVVKWQPSNGTTVYNSTNNVVVRAFESRRGEILNLQY